MTEAELLFTDLMHCRRPDLYLQRGRLLTKQQSATVSQVLLRRLRGEPLQYILGHADFFGLDFKVTSNVLIPRPETELLVEKAISLASKKENHIRRILDIGSGCGCIAVALAKNLPLARITSIDVCARALKVARANSLAHKVKVEFIKSDLFSSSRLQRRKFGMIVSNPPYIAAKDFQNLQLEVRQEPEIALNGGRDGLTFYRKIVRIAGRYLESGGFLIFEIGFGQLAGVKNIIEKHRMFRLEEVIKDYNNIDRVVVARII
jgi:release factor glutamine methyltransferase